MGLLKKIAKPFKKAVKKFVPKELAGIMQVAAPFTGAAAPFVYAAGAYKQSGKINPIVAASLALPYVGQIKGQGIGGLRYGDLSQYGTLGQDVLTARDLFKLRGAGADTLRGKFDDFLFGQDPTDLSFGEERMVPGTGEIETARFPATKGTQGILGTGGQFDLKGSKLLSGKDGKLSYAKVGAYVSAGLSLTETKEQIKDEGQDLGLSSGEIARLQAEAEEMWQDFDTTAFKPNVKDGGLMRTKFAQGTVNPFKPKPGDYGIEDNELPADPKPFRPKPNVGKMAEAVDVDILRQMFMEALKNGEIPPGTDFDTYKDMMMTLMSKTQAKKGGLMRTNFALGTMPTKEESGLGGLPIEADMRYTGGFMPYGAKEKADDVPARLSKNEFVFTADAVRAAGGGSVQKGAQRMYNTMKQLESMGKMA